VLLAACRARVLSSSPKTASSPPARRNATPYTGKRCNVHMHELYVQKRLLLSLGNNCVFLAVCCKRLHATTAGLLSSRQPLQQTRLEWHYRLAVAPYIHTVWPGC
jgi:hypothetical protein